MNCAEVKQNFEAAFDGAVNPEQERAVMLHIDKCPSCKAAWDEMQALRSALHTSVITRPSVSLDERVMSAFAQAHGRRESIVRPWWRSLFGGAISIPKPAFAVLLAAFALALVTALQIGRMTAPRISLEPPMRNADAAAAVPPPRIIYVPVETSRDEPTVKPAPATTAPALFRRPAMPRRTQRREATPGQPQVRPLESFTLVTATDTNYATKATLAGFEPMANGSVRIIKGRGE
jgi:hypothetical protein